VPRLFLESYPVGIAYIMTAMTLLVCWYSGCLDRDWDWLTGSNVYSPGSD